MYHRTLLVAGLAGALAFPWPSWVGAQEAAPQVADIEELRQQLQQAQEPVPLNRGPVHEAFAEPFTLDPEPGLIVPRRPPEPVEEIPPETRPEDENMVWFSGYWGWDAELEEFIWVSGVWRRPPPYQRWLPGYWNDVEEGWQWVPGTWVRAEQEELEYLPEPPQSLETGPTSEAPSDQHFWIPGNWTWQQERYVWRPGYWGMGHDDWVWMPDRYLWTPYGCVFSRGYWDYPIVRRGWLFAPHYFPFHQPGFVFSPFTPQAFIYPGHLFTNFWVWPGYRHYFFGNFFGLAGRHPGFFPWHGFHGFRRGYDPLFWHHGRMHPGGITAFHGLAHRNFDRFARHPHHRPPHTMRDLDRFRGRVDRAAFDRGAFARPFREGIDRRELGGSRRLDERQRREFAEAGRRMHQFSGQRRQLESRGARELADADRRGRRPQHLGLPSTRSTELRDARRAQQARRPDVARPDARRPGAGRTEARRPDIGRPDGRRPGIAQPDARRPDIGRTSPGRGPSVGRSPQRAGPTPDIRQSPGIGRTTPQIRGGTARPSTPQIRGGTARPSTPQIRGGTARPSTPLIRGGTARPSTPQFRGGTARPSTPQFRGGTTRPSTPQIRGGGSRPSTPSFRGGGSRPSTPSFRGGGGGGRSTPSMSRGGGGRGGSAARGGGGGRGGGRGR